MDDPRHLFMRFSSAQSTIRFEGEKWIHTSVDKHGKKSVVTRYIDDKGQQMIVCDAVDRRRRTMMMIVWLI
jgi:uncharacterized membrane protein